MVTCNYAVVRFLPYRETGEFVNVGVVLFCRESRFFDLLLETKETKRVKGFFPEMDLSLLVERGRAFESELCRVKDLLTARDRGLDEAAREGIFRELIRPRESIFRFGEPGTVLTEDPAGKLQELFERYVSRHFGSRPYKEEGKVMLTHAVEDLKEVVT